MSETAKHNTDADFGKIFALPLRLGKGTENEAPIFDCKGELVGQCVDDDCYERALAFIQAVNGRGALIHSHTGTFTRDQVIYRLETLRGKLESEGSYVRENTVFLAIEELVKDSTTQKPWVTEEQAAKLIEDAKASEAELPWAGSKGSQP